MSTKIQMVSTYDTFISYVNPTQPTCLFIGEHGYYAEGVTNDDAAPREQWENRKIMGLVWENFRGFRLETKLCDNLTGPSTNYLINDVMIRMIRESDRNISIQFGWQA